MSVFGRDYASLYDALYRDKDYNAECALVDALVKRHSNGRACRVLDLGCGTGNHALPLARRGYDVVGVDRSAGMLRQARQKAHGRATSRIEFRRGDVRTVRLSARFDVALIMFAVLGYQLTDEDVRATLATARHHLRPGGLIVFDVWHGPAVLAQRPETRVKVVKSRDEQVVRVTSGELDSERPVCTVRYRLWHLKRKRLVAEVQETHRMRYFFPAELQQFLRECGFEPVRFGAFPDFEEDPSETTWNTVGLGRAV